MNLTYDDVTGSYRPSSPWGLNEFGYPVMRPRGPLPHAPFANPRFPGTARIGMLPGYRFPRAGANTMPGGRGIFMPPAAPRPRLLWPFPDSRGRDQLRFALGQPAPAAGKVQAPGQGRDLTQYLRNSGTQDVRTSRPSYRPPVHPRSFYPSAGDANPTWPGTGKPAVKPPAPTGGDGQPPPPWWEPGESESQMVRNGYRFGG